MQLQAQFLLQNAHFILNAIASLAFFSISWLYFDAWTVQKKPISSLKWIGFLFVSISFVTHSIYIEQAIFTQPFFGKNLIEEISNFAKFIGYLLIIISLLEDRLQKKPDNSTGTWYSAGIILFTSGITISSTVNFLNAILAIIISFLYLRRATFGLENHLKSITIPFFLLSLFEVLSLLLHFQYSKNPLLFSLTAPFEILWIITHLVLFLSIALFGRWVFRYLTKRIQSQLFILFTTATMLIFLIITISFTFLLIRNVEKDQLKHLESDVGLLQYAINSKKEETKSDAELVAQNLDIALAIISKNTQSLRELSTNILLTKKKSSLIILDKDAKVLMRVEDSERYGDSMSSDPLFQRAIGGKSISTISIHEGVLAPTVSVRSAAIVKVEDSIIGVVIVGSLIDNAFVDGVKESTNLDSAVYAKNTRSATTLISPDGKSRWIGIKESDKKIISKVLESGKIYSGSHNIMNVAHLVSFAPLLDMDNIPIGMLFIGEKYSKILGTAGESIQLTFLISAILQILSIIPAYVISKVLSNQIR